MSFFKQSINKVIPATPPVGKNDKKDQNKTIPTKTKKTKQHPLLNAITDQYVDDGEIYKPRLSRLDRINYWSHLLEHKERRTIPGFFPTWVGKEAGERSELAHHSKIAILLFKFSVSQRWDQLYLNFFLLWIILLVVFTDGIAESYLPAALSFQEIAFVAPLYLMIICQAIPILGILGFMFSNHMLVQHVAIDNIIKWSFSAALIAQAFEFFYFCRRHRHRRHDKKGILHRILKGDIFRRHAKVQIEAQKDEPSIDDSLDHILDESSADLEASLEQSLEESYEGSQEQSVEGSLKIGEQGSMLDESIQGKPKNESITTVGTENENLEKMEKGEIKVLPIENNEGNKEINDLNVPNSTEIGINREEEVIDDGIEYEEWECIVCKTQNKEPKHPKIEADLIFGQKGVHYKRNYAKIQFRRDKPSCVKCFTYSDYEPPLGTSHLFPHNQKPYEAFTEYPKKELFLYGLKTTKTSIYYNRFKSFLFGLQDDDRALPVKNDWRLRKYFAGKFPEMPRYKLKKGEHYKVGEVVECKVQKFDWNRAKIIGVRTHRTYDIRYDTGDEVRFVSEKMIRLRPEKRSYAYYVELGMVFIVFLSPLLLAIGMSQKAYGMVGIPTMIVSCLLLSIRIYSFIQNFYNYPQAGICIVFRLALLYSLPLIFLMIAGALALTAVEPSAWLPIAVVFTLGIFSSLPVLYMMRVPFMLAVLPLFFQVSAGLFLLALYANGLFPFPLLGIVMGPMFSLGVSLKFLRRQLHNIWDVCLVVRPPLDTSEINPSFLMVVYETILGFFECFY